MHWRVQFDGGDPTVLKSAELIKLAEPFPPAAPPTQLAPSPDTGASLLVDLAEIVDNPFQPRLDYDDERVSAIAKSIREVGLLQVPLARKVARDRYELALGTPACGPSCNWPSRTRRAGGACRWWCAR